MEVAVIGLLLKEATVYNDDEVYMLVFCQQGRGSCWNYVLCFVGGLVCLVHSVGVVMAEDAIVLMG